MVEDCGLSVGCVVGWEPRRESWNYRVCKWVARFAKDTATGGQAEREGGTDLGWLGTVARWSVDSLYGWLSNWSWE